MFDFKLGIIGTGNMGTALLRTILNNNIIENEKIIIYDKDVEISSKLSREFDVKVAISNEDLSKKAEIILLAVKPQIIDLVLEIIGSTINSKQTIISIAAGVSINHISKFVKDQIGIIRIMPNTPLLAGAGASAMTTNKKILEEPLDLTKKIFNAGGILVELEEEHLDAVTGLSGSGPAYFFIMIEALADGGVKMGLNRQIALKLAAQTALGSAKLFLEGDKHPGELKDMVTSPGGTTITALHELEKGNLRATLIRAVEVATEKSRSLNKSKDS